MNKKIIALIISILLIIGIGLTIFMINNNQEENEKPQTISEALKETNNQSNQTNEIETERILILYFSRSGNTETIANYINEEIGGDLLKLETKVAYPTEYNELLDYAQKEKEENGRPELATQIDIDNYDVIFVGYPIWCYTLPMPIYSFFDSYDFTGKIIIPFTTHGTSGESGTFEAIKNYVPNATVLKGYNTYGNRLDEAKQEVTNWLEELGFIQTETTSQTNSNDTSEITIEIGDKVIYGTLDNTELANEIKEMLPLTVSMVKYGNREFYGGISQRPTKTGDGKLNFEDGDITYCPTNNTLAIFYSQSDRPNLTMEVIRIGKVTSDLSIFEEIESSVSMVFKISE